MQFWDDNSRKTISTKVKNAVYKRAKGRCERCHKELGPYEGEYHHIENPSIRPTSKTIQFLCRSCHRKHGHKFKAVEDFFGFKEKKLTRRKVAKKVGESETKTRRKAIRDDWTGEIIGYKTVKVKPKKKITKNKTTKEKPKTRRKAIRDEWGDIIGYKTVKVKPKETTTKKKTRKKKKKTEDDWW